MSDEERCSICRKMLEKYRLPLVHDGDFFCDECMDIGIARLLLWNGGDIRPAGNERCDVAAAEVIEFARQKGAALAVPK